MNDFDRHFESPACQTSVLRYSVRKNPGQDFRTAPYINYAYSLCSIETKGITIESLRDYFALFLELFIYFFLSPYGLCRYFQILGQKYGKSKLILYIWAIFTCFIFPAVLNYIKINDIALREPLKLWPINLEGVFSNAFCLISRRVQ